LKAAGLFQHCPGDSHLSLTVQIRLSFKEKESGLKEEEGIGVLSYNSCTTKCTICLYGITFTETALFILF